MASGGGRDHPIGRSSNPWMGRQENEEFNSLHAIVQRLVDRIHDLEERVAWLEKRVAWLEKRVELPIFKIE